MPISVWEITEPINENSWLKIELCEVCVLEVLD